MGKILLLILSFTVLVQASQAQLFGGGSGRANKDRYTSNSGKAIGFFEQGMVHFSRGSYTRAMDFFLQAVDKDEEFAEAHFRLGIIFNRINENDRAKAHLEQAVKYQKEDKPIKAAYYELAFIAFKNGNYQEAENHLQTFRAFDQIPGSLREPAKRLRENISFARNNMGNSLSINPQPVLMPSRQLPLQYFPVLTVDQQNMIFTGRRGTSPRFDEDIYISTKNSEGDWQEPEPISPKINTPRNEGTCTISADGQILIFTSCDHPRGYGSCDLYISRKTGSEWSVPQNLGQPVNSGAWESQPSLSADGRTLYFVSDRGGGQGERDIYVTHMNNLGAWEKPENLGPEVNTPQDDVSPFIHVNGRSLYFASRGYPGFGGFDLYFTEKISGKWTQPQNLGNPINTYDDEVSLFISADGRTAFYAYDQQKAGENQSRTSRIFNFKIPDTLQVQYKSSFVYGKVTDAQSGKALGAGVALYNLNTEERVSQVNSDSVNGSYTMVLTEGAEYGLYVDKKGYLFKSLTFDFSIEQDNSSNKNLDPVKKDIALQPIKPGMETTLNNIFFETDKYEIRPKSETELNRVVSLLENNPELAIKINGHTDNVGSNEYNQDLSMKRARAVYNYLLEAGIAENRLKYEGFGESQPVATNETPEGRQENRRITFEVLP